MSTMTTAPADGLKARLKDTWSAGNYDRFQGNFDFSGPIAPGSDVLYRMTGVVRDSNTEALGVPDDRLYLAPAVTFKVDPDTYLFWDDLHPTASGHRILAEAAIKLVASPQCDMLGIPSCAATVH